MRWRARRYRPARLGAARASTKGNRASGGWTFNHERPGDLETVPAALRARLLKHVLSTAGEDADKLGRAAFAFR